jgi:hypothetical protein
LFEYYRQLAQEAEQRRKPQPAPPNPAPGSMEWLAAQIASVPAERSAELFEPAA